MSAAGPPRVPKHPPPLVTTSPTIAALRPDGVEAFWAGARTPLVEPAPGRPDHRIVTFLWRDAAAREVVLRANKLTDPSVWEQSVLHRLPGTDLWHRSYLLRADYRGTYQLCPDHLDDPPAVGPALRWRGLTGAAVPDPRNPRTFPAKDGGTLSLLELPGAPAQPWAAPRTGTAQGALTAHDVPSAALGGARRTWLYVPVCTEGPLPVVVLLDGEDWTGRLDVRTTLDNLVADGAIPPTVVLLPDAVDTATRWQDLGCSPAFLRFLTAELLPWAAARLPLTEDPARTVVAGQSLGGLTAARAVLGAPSRFGAALVQSGSLWWPHQGAQAAGALVREVESMTSVPGRWHLQVGLEEWLLLGSHRRLHAAIPGSTLREHNGGHDAVCWRGGLADGLVELLG